MTDSIELTRRQILGAAVGAGSALYLTSCTTGELTQSVNAVVVAANLALGVLEATGVAPAAIVMAVAPYLSSVGQAVIDTNTEIQSMDSAAAKATKIAALWANLVGGVALPVNAPAILVTVIQQVIAAIKALLAIVGAGQLQLGRKGATAPVYQLTRGDRRELGKLTSQAMQIKARAMALAR